MSELKNFFANVSEKVEKQLDTLVPSADVEPKRLHSAIRWSLFGGGKRFRPALVIAVGKAFNVAEEKLLCSAAAIEMIHTYSLIHDDLPAMDNDKLRRGRETCHVKFDESTAILAGDCLQNLAFLTISEDKTLVENVRIRLISEVAKSSGTPFGMVAGQQLDLEAEGKTIDIKELERIHNSKTGAIICCSARIGAIIGEATESELASVTNYANSLGLLFQITDDLLDVTQTTEVLGKTAGKDLKSAKATYPSIYGIEEAQQLAQKVYTEAIDNLQKIERPTELLANLADFILHRKM
jgi:geranylgeranyl diphosphate synthase, type II